MTKKAERSVSVNVLIKGTVHEVSAPVDKSVVRSRGPKFKGQGKQQAAFQVNCSLEDWSKRWVKALAILKGDTAKPVPKPAAPTKPAVDQMAQKPAAVKPTPPPVPKKPVPKPAVKKTPTKPTGKK